MGFFFFSSRRRHTRCGRDWSSDVCSSDLDRLDGTIAELLRIRAEVGWPPLASPIGQFLGSQALLNVLSASRYSVVVDELRALVEGHLGTPPGPSDAAVKRAVALTADPESEEETTAPGLQE